MYRSKQTKHTRAVEETHSLTLADIIFENIQRALNVKKKKKKKNRNSDG